MTGVTFVSYFYGIKPLLMDAFLFELPAVAVFWCVFFTAATYINAGWMREQVCKYMCPYARFQSAMFDKDTLLVSYDKQRGEQRGSRKKGIDPATVGLGDCIDCTWCVQVCPTGIDIRDGLQYECINCAACVDACNSIMDKMGYERGLISYTTEHKEEGVPWTWRRPRLIGYGIALIVMITLFSYNVVDRDVLDLDVLRDRSTLYQELNDGDIQNSYLVKVLNKSNEDRQFVLSVRGPEGIGWAPQQPIFVKTGQVEDVALSITVPPGTLSGPGNEVTVVLQRLDDDTLTAEADVPFIGPSS
jgi:cytochrome c oxidase accessory protein FixG